MIAVILNILKVIGIALLCVLGIVVFLILTVLFVPVRYEAKGNYQESYAVKMKVSWCLHALSINFKIDTGHPLTIELRVFGIKLKIDKKHPKRKKNIPEKEKQENRTESTLIQEKDNEEQIQQLQESIPEMADSIEDVVITDEDENMNFWQKIKKCIDVSGKNIRYFIRKMRHFVIRGCKVKKKAAFYLNILQGEEFQAAFKRCKVQLLRILANLKPKKLQIHIHFGRKNEPDLVGGVLGIWGMTFPVHKGTIQVIPEFEQDVLKGDFYVKGRISLYLYLWAVYIVLFDKNIKHLKACVMQED